MDTFKVKIADLTIEIDKKAFNSGVFDNYLVNDSEKTDIKINNSGSIVDIHNELAEILPKYDGFVIHGAAISYKNKAYVFIAPSGTGKTTHINLWLKHIKDVQIINGDKPIIRRINGINYVCGSPWSGKEKQNSNICLPLDSIIIIQRANFDEIKQIDPKEYINDILKQVYIPSNNTNLKLTINLINTIFTNTKTYKLKCTKQDSAFNVCYEGLIDRQT